MKHNRILLALGAAAAAVSFGALASHSWGSYHWARTTSSFNLQVIDSVSPDWDAHLNASVSQWSSSTVLNLVETSADDNSRTRKRCPAVSGQMRVCNAAYGNNGWLGLASINLDNQGHIVRGTAKMNDSYASYWSSDPKEKYHVMCQEIGHVLGLGHTSEDGSSQQTCMDYSNDPRSTEPNAHDYQMLQQIYSHLDTYNSYSTTSASTSGAEHSMAGMAPMGVRVHRGAFHEVWAARDERDGSTWIHHVTLAPGFEHGDAH